MRKFINVRVSYDEYYNQSINVDVLRGPEQLSQAVGACGWLDGEDLNDLDTPARLMVRNLLGCEDEVAIEKLTEAFEEILTKRDVAVNVNYA